MVIQVVKDIYYHIQHKILAIGILSMIIGLLSCIGINHTYWNLVIPGLNLILFPTVLYLSIIFLEQGLSPQSLQEIPRSVNLSLLLRSIGLNLIISLGALIGFRILVIPGLIFLFLTCLSPYILIVERKTIKDAIQESIIRTCSNLIPAFTIYTLLLITISTIGLLTKFGTIVIPAPVSRFLGITLSTGIFLITLYSLYKAMVMNNVKGGQGKRKESWHYQL